MKLKFKWKSFIFSIKHTNISALEPDEKILIKRVTCDNIEDVLSFRDRSILDISYNFLQMGFIGYYAYFNDRCCHVSWVQVYYNPTWKQISPYVEMQLPKSYGYVTFVETASWARGKSIYPRVLDVISKENKNLDDILLVTNLRNQSSINALKKARAILRGTVTTFSRGVFLYSVPRSISINSVKLQYRFWVMGIKCLIKRILVQKGRQK